MDFGQEYTNYQIHRSAPRKFIRQFYLSHTLKYVKGKALDFGCGIGELLKLLPQGSIGLDVDGATVQYCRALGLPVVMYDPAVDQYRFLRWQRSEFTTFVATHVFEHLEHSDQVIRTIMQSCHRLGIERVIMTVPGFKGFKYDKTHRTFINEEYLDKNHLREISGFAISTMMHFPFNAAWIGRLFTHNELMVIYDLKP